MPKIQNLPPAAHRRSPTPYEVGQSLWFLMNPTDPNSECRSGVVTQGRREHHHRGQVR
jgi:hypothetical protein